LDDAVQVRLLAPQFVTKSLQIIGFCPALRLLFEHAVAPSVF
jgi:hypothetical protein